MIERLLSFADAGGDSYGAIAIAPGGERAAAYARAGAETLALADAAVSRGEGSIRVGDNGGELVLGVAAQTSPVGFEAPGGGNVMVQAFGASGNLGAGSLEGVGVAWTFEDCEDAAAVRTAWAALGDGSLLVVFATRPAGASDHAAESTGAARIQREGAVTPYAEPLLSTEYDADGHHTRATLELWGEDPDALPDRGAGEGLFGGEATLDDLVLRAARFDWRFGGVPGIGGYEIVAP